MKERKAANALVAEDIALFKQFAGDLEVLNVERNVLVHTPWMTSWGNDMDADYANLTARGQKFGSFATTPVDEISVDRCLRFVARCLELSPVTRTVWPLSINEGMRGPPLSTLWRRSPEGAWIHL